MSWSEQFEVTDSCCAMFCHYAKEGMRYSVTFSAKAIRALWRHADADERATIATRIAVWRNRETERVSVTQTRILERERQRLAAKQNKEGSEIK